MNSRKNRFISGLLSFVIVFTMVLEILPPIEVYAADGGTGGLKISSPTDSGTVNGYKTIKVSWNQYSGVDHYILIVKDQDTGKEVFRDDDVGSSVKTYNIYYDDYVFTEDGHEYKIYIAALDENDDELNNGAAWHAIYVTNELELETPDIISHGYIDTHCVDDALYVEWDPVDGANGYTVYVKRLNGDPDYDNDNESGTNITYTWSDDCEIKVATSNLVVGKWYKIALCADNTDQDISSDWTKVYILMIESSYLNISEYPDDLDAEKGSTGSFWIDSNLDWEISCDVSWLTWTINQYDDTHAEIIVKATSANTGTSDREAEFTISAEGVDNKYVYVTQLAPKIKLPSFSNVSISGNVSLGEKITWSADVNGNGSLLKTVSVGIYSKPLDDSIFFRNVNIDTETYSLSGSVTTGSIVSGCDASGNTKTLNMSIAGEYTVTLHAATDAAINNYAATDPVTITLTESTPCVTSLSVSPTEGTLSSTYTFTAEAENTDTVVFYVSGYKIGEVTSSSGTFQCTYNKFTSGGDRVVYAYPCDEYGNEVRTSGCYQTADFTITVNGTLSPVKILTDSYQSIDVNTSFTVEWADTASVPNDVSYNIYVWYDGKKVGDIMKTSSHSKTIPASYFTKEGRYIIGIYAISDTWAASSGVSIAVNVTVNTPYVENFAISPNTVSLGGTVRISGIVYGNGSDIDEIIIKITNNSDGTGGVYKTLYPNYYKLDMADTPAINTSDAIFTTPGTYSIKLYALNEGAVNEVLLGQKTLQVVADSKITLNTPELGGASTISYGDDYVVSWNYDETVDYYLIGISGLTYSKTVDASNSSYTIPFSVFKQYLGSSGSYFTVYVTAMSNSDTYLPSAKESKTVYVSGDASEKAVIKSVTLLGRDHNEVTAGETVTFEVVTSTDVEAIRMKDGAGTFIVNTWKSGYTDSGSNRTWTVKQKVSYAGASDVDYVNRSLTFYSMIGNTEYNKCNVTFICVKDAVVGAFDITKPVNGSEQQPEKSLTITWTTPDTGVDYYVVDITHNGVRIDEDVFPYEVRNGNSYTLDGSYLIRDNNAWNVQVTGCKADMADTSDSVRFVLKCQHEKLGTAVEKYLSYTNTGSSSTHSVKIEKTYPCLECGMTNAIVKTDTLTVKHNFIELDEGGKVCNQCWYIEDDGYVDANDYYIIGTKKQPVYSSINNNGDPYGYQYNEKGELRQVFVNDVIHIIGKKGSASLIQYPVSNGYWQGFISTNLLTPNQPGRVSARVNGEIINNVYYSTYDSKYYCSLIEAVTAFDGECTLLNGSLNISVSIYNLLESVTYTTTCDMRSVAGCNIYFSDDEGVKHIIWGSVKDDEIFIELEEFCTIVCGAEKISDTEYAIDYEQVELLKDYQNQYDITVTVASYINNVKFSGNSFYEASVEGWRINTLNVAQGIYDSITFDTDFYGEMLRKAGDSFLHYVTEDKRTEIMPEFENMVKVAKNSLADPVRTEVLMDIINISETSILKTIGENLGIVGESVKSIYDFCDESLENIVYIMNMAMVKNILPEGDAFDLIETINEFIKDKSGKDFELFELGFYGEDLKPEIDTNIPEGISIGVELVTTIAEFFSSYIIYYMNQESVNYIKTLMPYLDTYDQRVLQCVINVNSKFDLTYLLGEVYAGCGWEALDSFVLSQLSKYPLVGIPQLVGKVVESVTGNKKSIDELNKMTVTHLYLDAIVKKVNDAKAAANNKSIVNVKYVLMDWYFSMHINTIMNEYAVEYVKNSHKGPIYVVKKFFNNDIYTPASYKSMIKEENEQIEAIMKNLLDIIKTYN